MQHSNTVATWVTILSIVVGGGVWVGSVASDVKSTQDTVKANAGQIDKLRDQVPSDIAGMKSKIEAIESNVKDIKESQTEILRELRKK